MIIASDGADDAAQEQTNDLKDDHYIRLDHKQRIGAASSTLFAYATNKYDSAFVADATQTHHYATATCENIRHCDQTDGDGAPERVGSLCKYTQAGSTNK